MKTVYVVDKPGGEVVGSSEDPLRAAVMAWRLLASTAHQDCDLTWRHVGELMQAMLDGSHDVANEVLATYCKDKGIASPPRVTMLTVN